MKNFSPVKNVSVIVTVIIIVLSVCFDYLQPVL